MTGVQTCALPILLERQVGLVAPAVGFAGKEDDACGSFGGADESGKIGGQAGESELVDNAVALVIPRMTEGGRSQKHTDDEKTAEGHA